MFKKRYAYKLMKSLYALFIKIRSNPSDPQNLDIIKVFDSCICAEMEFNRRNIKKLKEELNKIGDFELKGLIFGYLEQVFIKRANFKIETIKVSLKPIKEILNELIERLEKNDIQKVEIMASAVHNYPDFILGNYESSPIDFWNEHIGYYRRTFNEPFLEEWKPLFEDYYNK